jgi:hypothetical protein
LTEGGYHLGTFAIMGVTTPTQKSRQGCVQGFWTGVG